MINENILLLMLISHWICDYALQTDEQALNKWKSFPYLISHTANYSLLISMAFIRVLSLGNFMAFMWITFIMHTITDFFTSKWVHKLFEKKDYHNGFVVMGLDQMLHYIQLYLTLKVLIG